MRVRNATCALLAMGSLTAACGGDPSGPSGGSPGPHFSVSPIDLDKLSGITPLGSNGKIFPIGHTYWWTCHDDFLFPMARPCLRERLPIRAPADGAVFAVEHKPDGNISIEGPSDLLAAFSHVTPKAGLKRGDRVVAGDTIATMYFDFAFDFGLTNLRLPAHPLLHKERFGDSYNHSQNPVAQYSGQLRTDLIAKVITKSDPMGRIAYDVAGTASGAWFKTGLPVLDAAAASNEASHLFLGRLQELPETSILVPGASWYSTAWGVVVPDAAYPDWAQITPASGIVWVKLWEIGRDGHALLTSPQGGVLLEVLSGDRIRIEWFNTHQRPPAFTTAAVTYER